MKRVELKIRENFYLEKEGQKPKLIKRNVVSKIKPYLEDIRLIGTTVNHKGNELKNFCKIYIRDIGYITVNHSYKELDNIQKKYNDGGTEKSIGFKK